MTGAPRASRWKAGVPAAVLLVWLVVLGLLLPRAAELEGRLEVGARVRASESDAVDSLIGAWFNSPFRHFAVLVAEGIPGPEEPEGRALLERLRETVGPVPGVVRVRSWESPADTLLLGPLRRQVLLVAGLEASGDVGGRILPALRKATTAALPAIRAQHPGARLRWTGESALNADLRAEGTRDARLAELRVLPVVLLLLVLTFGGILGAAIPVLAGALVVGCASGTLAWVAEWMPLSILAKTFTSMIGLGLGIDYALLVVARFREAGASGMDRAGSALTAARHAGGTVALSATAVVIGFLALLPVPVTEIRSIALGGIASAVFAALFAGTLLPVLLLWIGGILRPANGGETGRWSRWSRLVARRPRTVLLAALVPLLLIGLPTLRLEVGLPEGSRWLPPRAESVEALHSLEATGRDALLQTLRVLVELPGDEGAFTQAGWNRLRQVGAIIAEDPNIAATWSFASLEADRPPSRLAVYTSRREVRDTYLSSDTRRVLLEAIPRAGTGPAALAESARKLRAKIQADGPAGARVLVGGLPAMRVDYDAAIGRRLPLVAALVLAGTFLALLAGFRSILIPLKAILLNLLTVAAGFGAIVLAFQESAGYGSVFAFVPLLVFCTVFGLSMDYEVFLLARVAEYRRSGLDDRMAVGRALAATGPIITSAAAVMVTVFGAFALGEMVVIRMLGLALAVAILIDATLVRSALGPALVILAGRWNWWPGVRR